jgi:uncharacterized protein (DUF433 family)/DNA-binding transcriptional MerR regulator
MPQRIEREPRRANQNLLEYPTYTIPEAALYLGMPKRTLQSWVYDKPVWSVSGPGQGVRLLSFKDLAQAYFIEFICKHVGISGRKAREILKNARLETRSRYPLLHKDIKVLFKHILMDKPTTRSRHRYVVDLSQHRQLVMEEFVDLFASRIRRNAQGDLEQIYPWRLWRVGDERRPVTIDPRIMSGRLIITGTRIPVQTVVLRKQSGEQIRDIARDYGLKQETIKQALRHLGLRKAA